MAKVQLAHLYDEIQKEDLLSEEAYAYPNSAIAKYLFGMKINKSLEEKLEYLKRHSIVFKQRLVDFTEFIALYGFENYKHYQSYKRKSSNQFVKILKDFTALHTPATDTTKIVENMQAVNRKNNLEGDQAVRRRKAKKHTLSTMCL